MSKRDNRMDGYFIFKRGTKDNEWYEVVRNDVDWSEWLSTEFAATIGAIIGAAIIIAILIGLGFLIKIIFPVEYPEPEFLIENKIEFVQPNIIKEQTSSIDFTLKA